MRPFTRRTLVKTVGASAVATFTGRAGTPPATPDSPKIALELSPGALSAGKLDEAGMRRVKQLGVDHVLMGGPPIPWQEAEIRSRMETLKGGGLTLGNMMIGGFPKTLYGRAGRDEEIDRVRQSIRAAGRASLPMTAA